MLKWTPKAEGDLNSIMDYIEENFDVDTALEVIESILVKTECILSENPLAGSIVESNPLFSKLIVEDNSIYYCENPQDKDLYVVYVRGKYTKLRGHRLTTDEVP